jgi:hypothetical protein
MHEIWLQKYIQHYYQQIGFSQIHGPYNFGPDLKGEYAERPVKIEAEWDYSDYIKHKHPPGYAHVLVVATLADVPEHLKSRLPSIILNLDRQKVIAWAEPRLLKKNKEDFYAYPWRRLSKSLLDLYANYRQEAHHNMDFLGSNLAQTINRAHTPPGFQFGPGGKEEGFSGPPEEKSAWDYWLLVAHDAAKQFHLKPNLLHPTWIDRIALYFMHTGIITDGEITRFKDVAVFLDELLQKGTHTR